MPLPICIVRRWASSEPRKTRFEISDRYSSFFKNSESKSIGGGLTLKGTPASQERQRLECVRFQNSSR